MINKTKIIEVNIQESGNIANIFGRGKSDDVYDFESLSVLRKMLSNEKARIMSVIKNKKPSSIYSLAKILGRDFKSVIQDVKALEKFGFVDMISEKTGKRERLKPVLLVDLLNIKIKI